MCIYIYTNANIVYIYIHMCGSIWRCRVYCIRICVHVYMYICMWDLVAFVAFFRIPLMLDNLPYKVRPWRCR